MTCPRCQAENPAGQKFCGECGARLASACAACGAVNAPGQKFCGECGGAMLETRLKGIQRLPLMVLHGFYDPEDPDWDVRALLPAIRVPTLVMHGGDDRLVPASAAREVAARVQGAQLHVFEGSGHLVVSAGPQSIMVLWGFVSAPTPS